MKKLIFIYPLLIFIVACQPNQRKTNDSETVNTEEIVSSTNENLNIHGNYVDDGYKLKNQGYDWVSVSVSEASENSISISVRSRADKKRPTCTFNSKALKKDDSTYESFYNGKKIIYAFTESSIQISTETPEDENELYFFCSGGATISGVYNKIDGSLDSSQIDHTLFSTVLELQGVGFNISSIEKNGDVTVSIFTFGLVENEYNETFNLEGNEVTGAEVEDLNSDGSPELFIYTQSKGSGSYGNVLAFSVNNKKSMSQVYFPKVTDDPIISKGYMGHDEFTLIETSLVQRFPIYKDGDTNSNPTGGIRQITYRLKDGEAMRKLEIDTITEIGVN